jgi:hypothetical protein
VDEKLACNVAVTADITISGSIAGGAPCGTLEGEVVPPTISTGPLTGTFGAVAIETGTTGDEDLPDALVECPAALR